MLIRALSLYNPHKLTSRPEDKAMRIGLKKSLITTAATACYLIIIILLFTRQVDGWF